ncbi:uncharacterized protein LOC123260855 isoform X1 [Cotesia glomerata]|uniref:uncharacterized protein LOC123260855 isoform X1 n=1 Tax=Cotesia glomerata TaxID=32391 RepID=UPI001D01DBE2|nr:uncharacterized protein LOC123260855 isoform X1 [Cotesia glomerata]
MDRKLFLFFSLIISLLSQIHSKAINSKCFINDDLLALISQLDGYVKPLEENEVPIGMEFQLVREFTKSELNEYLNPIVTYKGVHFMINGKLITIDLNDNSPLSRKLELFLTEDRIEDSSLLMLEFTIDRIPMVECDGINHLKPPKAVNI